MFRKRLARVKPPTLSYFWVHFGPKVFCISFSELVLVHPKIKLVWYHENQKRLKWKTLQLWHNRLLRDQKYWKIGMEVWTLTLYWHQKCPLGEIKWTDACSSDNRIFSSEYGKTLRSKIQVISDVTLILWIHDLSHVRCIHPYRKSLKICIEFWHLWLLWHEAWFHIWKGSSIS